MRRKALISPASSVMAMHILSLSSVAFFAAAATAFSAVPASMLCLTIVMCLPPSNLTSSATCAAALPGGKQNGRLPAARQLDRSTAARVRIRHAQTDRRPQRPPEGPRNRGAGRLRHGLAADGGGYGL